MLASLLTTLALFISSSTAIQVTNPGMSTVWGTSGSQSISWKAVSTDSETFSVVLINQQGFLSNSPVTLISLQSTGSPNIENSASVSFPNGNWPTGYGFQINLMSTANGNTNSILAQSSQFNISSSGSAGMSSSASAAAVASSSVSSTTAMAPTTITNGAGASVTSATAAASGANASGGIPNAVTSSRSGASALFVPSMSLLTLGGAVAFFL